MSYGIDSLVRSARMWVKVECRRHYFSAVLYEIFTYYLFYNINYVCIVIV